MSMADRYRSQPRAVRWLIWFGCLVLGYFLVIEPVVDMAVAANGRADDYRAKLQAYDRKLDAADAEVADLKLGMSRFGRVDMPGAPERRPGELNAQIGEILRKHNVTGQSTRSSDGTLRPGPLSEALGGRIGTRVRDIEFRGTPEQITRVLADLEQSPVIAAVTAVEITQADDRRTRMLDARITAEAWIDPEVNP